MLRFKRTGIHGKGVRRMRKTIMILAVMVSLFIITGSVLAAGIVGTKHDLSANRDDGQVCVFCHVPHNPTDKTLLWSRDIPNGTFTMYANSTLDGTIDDNLSGTASLLCMSCHDGVTATDITLNNGTNLGGEGGKDLSNDHPVNITYAYGVDPGLKDPDAVECILFGEDDNKTVQCASCHNVHGQNAEIAGVTETQYQDNHGNIMKFLRVTPEKSGICLDCHIK